MKQITTPLQKISDLSIFQYRFFARLFYLVHGTRTLLSLFMAKRRRNQIKKTFTFERYLSVPNWLTNSDENWCPLKSQETFIEFHLMEKDS